MTDVEASNHVHFLFSVFSLFWQFHLHSVSMQASILPPGQCYWNNFSPCPVSLCGHEGNGPLWRWEDAGLLVPGSWFVICFCPSAGRWPGNRPRVPPLIACHSVLWRQRRWVEKMGPKLPRTLPQSCHRCLMSLRVPQASARIGLCYSILQSQCCHRWLFPVVPRMTVPLWNHPCHLL